ncbi:hypothetical protein GALMADRAFT_226011 [Galerina marginata CBS 339.88]|uniref:Molybdopterin synthase sulfur carrier subunit n=1 Tax=Galerina marginata (strain CBS 339.88) TaxID=685588 RepID=A0A067T1W9_GALM3|nr:hypothetical protein GALMADRAFT_226011 [Galerina marginata CBS 339.88]
MASRTNTITVLYFAAASTTTGRTSEEVPIPEGLKLCELTDLLVERHPNTNLKEIIDTSQWSVDLEMVEDPEAIVLKGGEEVAIICPVSGG